MSSQKFGFSIWRKNLSSEKNMKFFRRTILGLSILPKYD